MRKFITELFTNRFGIVLVALNLCFFASVRHYSYEPALGKLFLYANFPSAGSTILALGFIKTFICKLSPRTEIEIVASFFFPMFIILQWLLIARVAKTFAAGIRHFGSREIN